MNVKIIQLHLQQQQHQQQQIILLIPNRSNANKKMISSAPLKRNQSFIRMQLNPSRNSLKSLFIE